MIACAHKYKLKKFAWTFPAQLGDGSAEGRGMKSAAFGLGQAGPIIVSGRTIASNSSDNAGPGFLAYIPGGGLFASSLADLLSTTIDRYVNLWGEAPVAAQIEYNVVRWLCDLFAFPPESRGVLLRILHESESVAASYALDAIPVGDIDEVMARTPTSICAITPLPPSVTSVGVLRAVIRWTSSSRPASSPSRNS